MVRRKIGYGFLVVFALFFGVYMISVLKQGGYDEFFWIFSISVAVITLILIALFLYYEVYKGEKKIQHSYLIAAIGIGMIMNFVIPTLTVPDETTHLYNAYRVSNKIMGISPDDEMVQRSISAGVVLDFENEDLIPMRLADARYAYQLMKRKQISDFYSGCMKTVKEPETIVVKNTINIASDWLYYFPGFGLSVGRWLKLSPVMTFILGRFFNSLLFILLTFFAIKMIPFAKSLVFVWALLPVTVQQASSFSYDCVINGLSIFVVSMTLYFLSKKKEIVDKQSQENLKQQTIKDRFKKENIVSYIRIIALFFAAYLLFQCKAHALLLISALVLLVVFKWIKENKAVIVKTIKEKRWVKVLLVLAGIVVLFVLCKIVARILVLFNPANQTNREVWWSEDANYTLSYIFQNPKGFMHILMNTVWVCGDDLVMQMLGGCLGNLNVRIPMFVSLPFAFLLMFAAVRRENEEVNMTLFTKICFGVAAAGTCIIPVLAMFLYWTPRSYEYVAGVQGRYFLPALVPMLLLIRSKHHSVGKNTDQKIVFLTVFLYVLVLLSIMRYYLY